MSAVEPQPVCADAEAPVCLLPNVTDGDTQQLPPASDDHVWRLVVVATGPSAGPRNRVDTHGADIRDSSITLTGEHPGSQLFAQQLGRLDRRTRANRSRRRLPGADLQFTSSAHTTVDPGDLQHKQNAALATYMRTARGKDYLEANLIKIACHASTHGANLELLEHVGAPIALVSSIVGGAKRGLPYPVAMEAVREAPQATTTESPPRKTDRELGIHVTSSQIDTAQSARSVAVLVSWVSDRPLLLRVGDIPSGTVDLGSDREVK